MHFAIWHGFSRSGFSNDADKFDYDSLSRSLAHAFPGSDVAPRFCSDVYRLAKVFLRLEKQFHVPKHVSFERKARACAKFIRDVSLSSLNDREDFLLQARNSIQLPSANYPPASMVTLTPF